MKTIALAGGLQQPDLAALVLGLRIGAEGVPLLFKQIDDWAPRPLLAVMELYSQVMRANARHRF